MKRQHPSEERDEPHGRASKARDDQALDLNATPRGFDLNAPFPEEEGQEWNAGGSSQEDAGYREIFKQKLEPAGDLGIDEELDLLHSIWSTSNQENWQRLDEILESVCEEIGKFPSSPPKYQYLTCLYVSKKLPAAFGLPKTYKVLLSFFDSGSSEASAKKQNVLPAFSCKLLFRAFSEKPEWPLDFVKVYLEDTINLRNWVDNELCKEFVANVLTAFDEDLTVAAEDLPDAKGDLSQCNVKNRYPSDEVREKAKADFLKALNQLLKVPTTKENPRVLRMMTLGVKHEEVRVIASSMIEGWLNSAFHFRRAKLLLDRILHFTTGTTSRDIETIANFLSMRLNQGVAQIKNTSSSLYTDLVFQIVQKRPEYSSLALKTFLTAEVNATVPHNVKGIAIVLKALPDSLSPERALALVIKELALSEDNIVRLQDSISKVLKQLSKDISPFLLCRALLEPWDAITQQSAPAVRSWFKQIIGLACHFLIQAAAPFASDEKFLLAISTTGKGFKDDSSKEMLSHFKDLTTKIMTFQEEALTWCVDVLSTHLSSEDSEFFTFSVQKLMFLLPTEDYHLSASSSSTEINSFQLVAFSMHASEEILARVILMGISNQYPMLQEDALHIIEKLVWRAAASEKHIFGTLFADNTQLPAAIMKLSSFSLPSVSRQPLPQLALKDLFWRSCLVIIVIAAYNPSTIGKTVWENFPSVRYLLQYLITEGSNTGLPSVNILDDEEAVQNDLNAEEMLEAFLSNEQIPTDDAERWKGNILLLNNQTNRRKPPNYVLEELKEIDSSYNVSKTIRSSKDPSFMYIMTSSQEFKEAWEWIQKVAEKQPAVLGMLPYDWQGKVLYHFEYLAADTNTVQDLRLSLRKLFSDDKASEGDGVLKFLCTKLVSKNSTVRACGRKCISGIMSGAFSTESDSTELCQTADFSWIEMLEKANQTTSISSFMQEALLYESSIDVVWAYLKFLKKHLSTPTLAYVIARLIVSRKLLASGLLSASAKDIVPSWNGDNKFPILELVLESFDSVCSQPASKWDQVHAPLVKLVSRQSDGTLIQTELPSLVLEAMVELLVLIGSSDNAQHREMVSYGNILRFLFPGFVNNDGDLTTAYIVPDSGEKVSILSKQQQDNLVRSNDIRLVRTGFSTMELPRKVAALIRLRLSFQAKELLLDELNMLPETSVDHLFQSLSAWERSWICGCFPSIEGKSPFASRICELRKQKGNSND